MKIYSLILVVLAVGGPFVLAAPAATTSFSYTATSGSWVGDGVTSFYQSPSTGWTFNGTVSSDQTFVDLTANATASASQSGPQEFELWLKAPAGQTLQVGDYPEAERYPFEPSNVPGFWLFGNGRGDNVDTGYFDVLDFSVGPQGTLNSFAVQFQQFDEGNPNEWVQGLWLYNSSVPEPTSSVLLAATVGFGLLRRTRQRI